MHPVTALLIGIAVIGHRFRMLRRRGQRKILVTTRSGRSGTASTAAELAPAFQAQHVGRDPADLASSLILFPATVLAGWQPRGPHLAARMRHLTRAAALRVSTAAHHSSAFLHACSTPEETADNLKNRGLLSPASAPVTRPRGTWKRPHAPHWQDGLRNARLLLPEFLICDGTCRSIRGTSAPDHRGRDHGFHVAGAGLHHDAQYEKPAAQANFKGGCRCSLGRADAKEDVIEMQGR